MGHGHVLALLLVTLLVPPALLWTYINKQTLIGYQNKKINSQQHNKCCNNVLVKIKYFKIKCMKNEDKKEVSLPQEKYLVLSLILL